MTDYSELVKALRCCAENFGCPIECPRYSPADEGVRACVSRLEKDAAAAIEELENALADECKECDYLVDENTRLTTENEELQAEAERLKAQLPKRGEWKPFDLTYGRSIYSCSVCEQATEVPMCMEKPMYAYCPNCGAKMEVQDG